LTFIGKNFIDYFKNEVIFYDLCFSVSISLGFENLLVTGSLTHFFLATASSFLDGRS
jgi:hypothetical protein